MSARIQQIAGTDRTIHEPARLMVVALLDAVDEADFQYLHQATGLTKGNLSVPLSKLQEAVGGQRRRNGCLSTIPAPSRIVTT